MLRDTVWSGERPRSPAVGVNGQLVPSTSSDVVGLAVEHERAVEELESERLS